MCFKSLLKVVDNVRHYMSDKKVYVQNQTPFNVRKFALENNFIALHNKTNLSTSLVDNYVY